MAVVLVVHALVKLVVAVVEQMLKAVQQVELLTKETLVVELVMVMLAVAVKTHTLTM